MSKSIPPSRDVEAIVEELLQVTGQLRRRLRAAGNEGELSLSQVGALKLLDTEGPMTTAELARAEAVKPQSMGGTLAPLEEAGLIARSPHPTDGRQILVSITEAGRAMRHRRLAMRREWLAAALSQLDPEAQHTLDAALAVIRRLGES